MKWKRMTGLILLTVLLAGCGSRPQVDSYPSNALDGTNDTSVTNGNSWDGKSLQYTICSSSGLSSFIVNAKVEGSTEEDYPVYEVLPRTFTNEDLKEYCAGIFDTGSMNVILPYFLAQSDYIESRIRMLTERKDRYTGEGKEVPPYIEEDLKALMERRESNNLNAPYTIPWTNEIAWTSLHDFYQKEKNKDLDCSFCYVEGTINGEYYRLNFTDYTNDIVVNLFRLDKYFDESSDYYNMTDDTHLPFDKTACNYSQEEAVSLSEDYLNQIGLDDYVPIAVYPSCIYGRMDTDGEFLKNMVSGYACYFAREVNGKTRPYCDSIDDSFVMIPHYNNLIALADYEDYNFYYPMEVAEGSGVYRCGYEYLRVSVTNNGIDNLFWNCPADVGEVKTDSAELLSFDEVDLRAREYLQYYTDFVNEITRYKASEIDSVKMGMARVTADDGHYYMVPAWYYYLKSDLVQVEKNIIVCINAIDGTVINVENGGNTIDFD